MIGKTNAISGVSAPVPKIKTVSGSVISISDALAQAAESLVVGIEPVQSGSGDPSPSNVRPISGWSAVNVTRTGKNLIDDSKTYFNGTTAVYVGAESSGYAVDLPAGTYTISVDFSGELYAMYYREENDDANRTLWTTSSGDTEKTFTIEEDGTFRFWVYRSVNSGGVDPTKIIHVQIELGSTATDYEPYNGNTYTIQLGQTIYGGSLDVVSGVLTVDMASIDLGSLSWTYYTAQQIPMFYADISGGKVYSAGASVKAYCSDYKVELTSMSASNFSNLGYFHAAFNSSSTKSMVLISDSRYTDANTFKTAMSGVQLVYELATPQTVQLTPTEIQMLLGNNTLWADSGDSELQYWARR